MIFRAGQWTPNAKILSHVNSPNTTKAQDGRLFPTSVFPASSSLIACYRQELILEVNATRGPAFFTSPSHPFHHNNVCVQANTVHLNMAKKSKGQKTVARAILEGVQVKDHRPEAS